MFGLFKKPLPVTSMPWPPWFGPVSEAPAAVRAVLDRTPSWQMLAHREWSVEKTLVYAPEPDVKPIAQPFMLALLLNNVEKDDPFPSRLGVALAKP